MFILLLVVKIEKQRDDDDDILLFPSFLRFVSLRPLSCEKKCQLKKSQMRNFLNKIFFSVMTN